MKVEVACFGMVGRTNEVVYVGRKLKVVVVLDMEEGARKFDNKIKIKEFKMKKNRAQKCPEN